MIRAKSRHFFGGFSLPPTALTRYQTALCPNVGTNQAATLHSASF